MKQDKKYIFEEAPIGEAISSFAAPMMIAMLVSVVYNLVDTFYIGLLGDYNLMAAVSLALPISTVFMEIGNIFGVGGGNYISRLLGAADKEEIKKVSSFTFYTPVVLGVVLTVLGFIFMEPLLSVLGTSNDTIIPTRQYVTIILIGGVANILSFFMSQIIRSEGGAKVSMNGNIIGTAANIVLDPIFLFVLHGGIRGIAIATTLSQVITAIYYIYYTAKKSVVLSLRISDFGMERKMIGEVMKIGIPSFLQNIVMIFSNIVQNNLAAGFGDVYVAAFGIIFKLSMMPKLLSRGLCQGIQPLIGYNYTAKNMKRIQEMLKKTFSYSNILCLAFFVVGIAGSSVILNLFSHNEDVVLLGTPMFRIATVSFLTYTFAFLSTGFFQAVGKAFPAFIMSLAQGIFFIPLVILLSYACGIYGFAWALPVADIITGLLGTALFFYHKRCIQ